MSDETAAPNSGGGEGGAAAPENAAAGAGGDGGAGAGGGDTAAADANRLQVRVASPDGNLVYFRIKRTTQMSKLMAAYCQRLGQSMDAVRFVFDGVRIDPKQTAQELGLEPDDKIDAFIQQVGGGAAGAAE